MNKPTKLGVLSAVCSALLLAGCGGADTTIVEKEPQKTQPDDGHDHGSDLTIDSLGRLAITSFESDQVAVFDLDESNVLDTFTSNYPQSSIYASAGYRYVVVKNRDQGHIGFIDGGLWREDHVAHLHDYEQAPTMLNFQFTTSKPTHVVKHGGAMAIFNDGDSELGATASVNLLTDEDITAEKSDTQVIDFTMNMHGVAEPRGEHLLTTVRRDDASSTSAAKVLPDQVAVYHQHGDEYEQEQLIEIPCPNLHGAAQSEQFVAFGCNDGVLLAKQAGDEYTASKVANLASFNGARIGSLYGNAHHDSLFGIASSRGSVSKLIALDPNNALMSEVDWQPQDNAVAQSYAFSADGDAFVILDDKGYLTTLVPHTHGNDIEWEFSKRADITEQDVSLMPENQGFKLTMSQHEEIAYISDPMAKTVVAVDLSDMSVSTVATLDFVPDNLVWLGIKTESEHAH